MGTSGAGGLVLGREELEYEGRAWRTQCRPGKRTGQNSFSCTVAGERRTQIHKEVPAVMVLGRASCLGPSDDEQGFSNFHGHRFQVHCVKVQTLKEV